MNSLKPKFDFSNFEERSLPEKGITTTEVVKHIKELTLKGKEEKDGQSVRTLEELLKLEGTEQPKLLEPLLLKTGLTGIIGSSDTGKSCLARQLCLHIIEGKKKFLSFKLNTTHKQAIYVTTEDDEGSTAFAYKRMLREGPCSNPSGLRVIFEQAKLLEQLDELLLEQPADIVVIDAYLDIAPPDSNQATQTRQLLHQYRSLSNKYNTLILFVHHTGKSAKNLGPSKHGAVGSQSWEAKLRTVMELRSDAQEPNKKHLCVVKGNNISQEFKNSSFLLEFDESTLSFSNTGKRVPFEDLTPNLSSGSVNRNSFKVDKIPEERHKEWLESVFCAKTQLKRFELVKALKEVSGLGNNAIEKADGLLNYWLGKGLIFKISTGIYGMSEQP